MQDASQKTGSSIAEIVLIGALLVFFALAAFVRF